MEIPRIGAGFVDDAGDVMDVLCLGRGLALMPNLHVGKQAGSKAFVQTSTGAISEISEPDLPIKAVKSGKTSWKDID